MIDEIKKIFIKKKMRKLIKTITKAIYSEEYKLESLINKFADKNNLLSLLQCYISIKYASELNEPISNEIINTATNEFLIGVKTISHRKTFDEYLKLHTDLAKICFLEKMIAILERKQTYENDKYTFEGLVYALEWNQKGPISNIEREKYKKLSEDYKETVLKYNEYIKGSEETLQKEFEKCFNKIKFKVEDNIKIKGPKSKEVIDKEYEDLTRQFIDSFNDKKE